MGINISSSEIWKSINEFEGFYEISNLGNVRSLDRVVKGRWGPQELIGKKLTASIPRSKYPHVHLRMNGEVNKHISVHRLIAQAFIPNPNNKPEVNHKNGIKTDNSIDNLEWVTSKENSIHAAKIGLLKVCKGADHVLAKFTNEEVFGIKFLISIGFTMIFLSKLYDCSPWTIYRINKGVTYRTI